VGTLPALRADASAIYNPIANSGTRSELPRHVGAQRRRWVGNGGLDKPDSERGGRIAADQARANPVYDPAHHRMTIYGGDAQNCSSEKLGDVWILTNATGSLGAPKWHKTPFSRRAATAPLGSRRRIGSGGAKPASLDAASSNGRAAAGARVPGHRL
jgi:hypothetical protein